MAYCLRFLHCIWLLEIPSMNIPICRIFEHLPFHSPLFFSFPTQTATAEELEQSWDVHHTEEQYVVTEEGLKVRLQKHEEIIHG